MNRSIPITATENPLDPAYSPPEFVKRANARDSRASQALSLRLFLGWLQSGVGLLRELPADKIDTLIADYLDAERGQP